MNLAINLIVDFPSYDQAQQMKRLLQSTCRPLFVEDVAPEDKVAFEAIQYIHTPDELKVKKKRLLVSWYETEHSFVTLKNAMEKVGGEVLFAHVLEDGDPIHYEDIGGVFFYRVHDQFQRLNKNTYKQMLSDYDAPWHRDSDKNVDQLTRYLMKQA